MRGVFKRAVLSVVSVLCFTPMSSGVAVAAVPGNNEQITVSTGGTQGNNNTGWSAMSRDGRYIALFSSASNLVSGDTNNKVDAFVRDRVAGTMERVSISTGGTQGNGDVTYVNISGDGRYVVFESIATNLTADSTGGMVQVFLHDRLNATTEMVSKSTGGAVGNNTSGGGAVDVSDDGRFVAFGSQSTNLVSSDTNATLDIFVRDRRKSTTSRISTSENGTQSNDYSSNQSMSCDGRYTAFQSAATNLVAGDTNADLDIFVYDQVGGTLDRITNGNSYSVGPLSISCNGRYVAFISGASDLVAGDSNGRADTFVYDRSSGATERVSVSTGGTQGNLDSAYPVISDDGRFVAFHSDATNLVTGDTNSSPDIFLRDRQGNTTELLTRSSGGTIANGTSVVPSISADGTVVSYYSEATNLIGGDTNATSDIYVSETGGSAGCTLN